MDDMTMTPLRVFREGRGLRQVDVASFLGVTQQRIAVVERHRIEGLRLGTVADYVAAAGGRVLVGAELPGDVMVPLWWRPKWEVRG